MTTVVLRIPDKKEKEFQNFVKKHHLRKYLLEINEDQDLMAKWVDEGMKSEDVPIEKIFALFRKNGINY